MKRTEVRGSVFFTDWEFGAVVYESFILLYSGEYLQQQIHHKMVFTESLYTQRFPKEKNPAKVT